MMVRVNGELLDPNLIEETFHRLKSEAEQKSQVSCCERDSEFYQAAEEEVIDSVLIAQEAEQRAQEIPSERIKEELAALVKRYRQHGASWEMIEANQSSLHEEVTASLRMSELLKTEVGKVKEVSEDELRNYYESHKKDHRTLPEVHCLHLVQYGESMHEQRDLLDAMVALRNRLLEGEDFLALAKVETHKDSGEVDLGWIPLDRPSNPFETVLFSLQVGEISPVLSYESALHLVTVIERRGGEAPPFEEVRDMLAENWRIDQTRAALQKLAKRLRLTASIERVNFSGDAA